MKKRPAAQPIRKTWLILAFFIFALLSPLYPSNTQCEWSGIQKIVAVGDLHGDYDSFVDILKGTRLVELVDKKLHWTGGKTHLVQIGDVMDKGDRAKDILELLKSLETEAERAGGKVHLLLGNHEEMNITGIAWDYENYVTLNQFIDFLPEEYKERKERGIRKDYAKKPPRGQKLDYPLEQRLRNYWETARSKAIADRQDSARLEYIRNFREKYGKWLVEHNVVIKINDIIFVHGGISERFSTWKLEDINNRMRLELNSFIRENPIELQVVYESDGPVWYRGLSTNGIKQEDLKPEVDKILQNLKARYMVMAHTPQIIKTRDELKRFDGRIWVIDTGIGKAFRSIGGRPTALIIEDTGNDYKFSVWPLDFGEEGPRPVEQTKYRQEGTAIKTNQLLEFVDSILRDALRIGIFYGGKQ